MATAAPTELPVSPMRWWVCFLLMLATIINYMDRLALNQMGVRIMTYFSLSNYEYGLLESAFAVAFGLGAIISGVIVDKISVRWVYPIMVLGWSAAGVLTGFANSYWMLLSCRVALGLFESSNWPCGIRTTRAILRRDERSLGNSIFQSGTALGAVITPLLILALLRSADPGEPTRNAIMSVTGGTYAAVSGAPADTWKYPFRVIGSLGVIWVVLWFIFVPKAMLQREETAANNPEAGIALFRDVLRDIRFWVILSIAIGVNITWHGYRAWLPIYLQKQRGFTEAEMSRFTTAYYLVADIGSWTVGGITLYLCRRGLEVHRCRVIMLGTCAFLALGTFAVPFLPNGWPLAVGMLVVAFGALGLFPTYFAFTQELSSKHQGKVSGTMGLSAHLSLAAIYPFEGWVNDVTGSYHLVLGFVGVTPMLAFLFLLWKWPSPRPPSNGPA